MYGEKFDLVHGTYVCYTFCGRVDTYKSVFFGREAFAWACAQAIYTYIFASSDAANDFVDIAYVHAYDATNDFEDIAHGSLDLCTVLPAGRRKYTL